MKRTTADHGSLRLDFRVQVNPAGLVTVNRQAVGKSDTGRLQRAAQMLQAAKPWWQQKTVGAMITTAIAAKKN